MFSGIPCWLSICCTQGPLLSPMATALSRQERTTMQAAGDGRAHQTNTTRDMAAAIARSLRPRRRERSVHSNVRVVLFSFPVVLAVAPPPHVVESYRACKRFGAHRQEEERPGLTGTPVSRSLASRQGTRADRQVCWMNWRTDSSWLHKSPLPWVPALQPLRQPVALDRDTFGQKAVHATQRPLPASKARDGRLLHRK